LLAAAAAAPPPTLPRSELNFISTNNRCILGSESLSLLFPRCTNSGGRVRMFARQLVTYATRLRSVCVAQPIFTYSLPLSVHRQQFAYSRSIERRGQRDSINRLNTEVSSTITAQKAMGARGLSNDIQSNRQHVSLASAGCINL
jgi:hypothetical protein